MKAVLCLLFLAVAVYAEPCTTTRDCVLTDCGDKFQKECYSHGQNTNHICTCVPNTHDFRCSHSSTCESTFGSCNLGDHRWHCSDHRCRCSSHKDDD